MASEGPQITVTPARVGFFLSLVAVVTLGWNTFNYFKAGEIKDIEQDARITVTEDQGRRFETSLNKLGEKTDKLSDKTDELKEAMIRLTTVIEQSAPEKRADYTTRSTPGLIWENIASKDK